MCKQMIFGSFKNVTSKLFTYKNVTSKLFTYKSYLFNIYWYKQDLTLNNSQGLMCYKTQSNHHFGGSSECSNYNWYHCHPSVLQLFSSLAKSKIFLSCHFAFFRFCFMFCRNGKIHKMASCFLVVNQL